MTDERAIEAEIRVIGGHDETVDERVQEIKESGYFELEHPVTGDIIEVEPK